MNIRLNVHPMITALHGKNTSHRAAHKVCALNRKEKYCSVLSSRLALLQSFQKLSLLMIDVHVRGYKNKSSRMIVHPLSDINAM